MVHLGGGGIWGRVVREILSDSGERLIKFAGEINQQLSSLFERLAILLRIFVTAVSLHAP